MLIVVLTFLHRWRSYKVKRKTGKDTNAGVTIIKNIIVKKKDE